MFSLPGITSSEDTVVGVVAGTALLIRYLYSFFFYLALPVVFLRLLWRSRKEPVYRSNLLQRLGFGEPLSSHKLIWVHAVSAGETIAATPLVLRLLSQGYEVLITNMTPTGRERAFGLLGRRVENRYAPYDTPGAVKRFLRLTNPRALIIVDTELWPNMLHYAAARGVKTIVVNGRLSEKSTRGYQRISALSFPMMTSIFRVAAQSEPQGRRFVALGLEEQKLSVTGSTKFDVEHDKSPSAASELLGPSFHDRFVLVAASTHHGEEEEMLKALTLLEKIVPDILLVLVPRHPYRAEEVLRLCKKSGFITQKHSDGRACDDATRVYLLDTMGELMTFFGMANAAFVGGSLAPTGGHNPMEPASFGVPVFMGPYIRNVSDIAQQFIDEGGMKIVHTALDLVEEIQLIQSSEAELQRRVEALSRVMMRNKGALDRVEKLVVQAMEQPTATIHR